MRFKRLPILLFTATVTFSSAIHGSSHASGGMNAPKSVESMNLYGDVVHNIFEQNCITCHNAEDRKGELVMETYEGLLEGGDSGYSLAPGDRADSELYFRITLPHDNEDFMPTEDKPPLSREEIATIGWWIDQGADREKTIGEYEDVPSSIIEYGRQILESNLSAEELEKRKQERLALYKNLAQLKEELGVVIVPTKPNATTFTLETFAIQKQFDSGSLDRLAEYGEYFVSADLSGTPLGDDALEDLTAFRNLEHLNLSKTRITGKSLSKLSALPNLRSLNLYGAPLTGEAVSELSKLSQLRNLYLFQTSLDEEPVKAKLRSAIPQCNFGLN